MRPVSAGKLAARAAWPANSSVTKTKAARAVSPTNQNSGERTVMSVPSNAGDVLHLSELHLRRRLRTLVRSEFRHRLFPGEHRLRPEHGRKGAQRRIKGAHRVDVIAPRNRNTILRAFELRLQC